MAHSEKMLKWLPFSLGFGTQCAMKSFTSDKVDTLKDRRFGASTFTKRSTMLKKNFNFEFRFF